MPITILVLSAKNHGIGRVQSPIRRCIAKYGRISSYRNSLELSWQTTRPPARWDIVRSTSSEMSAPNRRTRSSAMFLMDHIIETLPAQANSLTLTQSRFILAAMVVAISESEPCLYRFTNTLIIDLQEARYFHSTPIRQLQPPAGCSL